MATKWGSLALGVIDTDMSAISKAHSRSLSKIIHSGTSHVLIEFLNVDWDAKQVWYLPKLRAWGWWKAGPFMLHCGHQIWYWILIKLLPRAKLPTNDHFSIACRLQVRACICCCWSCTAIRLAACNVTGCCERQWEKPTSGQYFPCLPWQ